MKLTGKNLAAGAGATALVAAIVIPATMSQASSTKADSFYASVNANATLVPQHSFPTAGVIVGRPFAAGAGDYRVVLPGVTANCANLANINIDGAGSATAIPSTTVTDPAGTIVVHTFNRLGVPADFPFDLVAIC